MNAERRRKWLMSGSGRHNRTQVNEEPYSLMERYAHLILNLRSNTLCAAHADAGARCAKCIIPYDPQYNLLMWPLVKLSVVATRSKDPGDDGRRALSPEDTKVVSPLMMRPLLERVGFPFWTSEALTGMIYDRWCQLEGDAAASAHGCD